MAAAGVGYPVINVAAACVGYPVINASGGERPLASKVLHLQQPDLACKYKPSLSGEGPKSEVYGIYQLSGLRRRAVLGRVTQESRSLVQVL